jgi:hypothetical protein
LKPGEASEYKIIVGRMEEPGGSPAPPASGRYTIQARLAEVRYLAGKYETTLIESNAIEVAVSNP